MGIKDKRPYDTCDRATGFVGGKIMEVCKDVVASPSLRDATLEKVKRIIDESGERNEYTIRGYKDLSGQESLCSTYF